MPLFRPKTDNLKRTNTLPQCRVSDQERAVAEFLAQRLTEKEKTPFTLADVLRLGLGVLYEREFAAMSPEEKAAAPLKVG